MSVMPVEIIEYIQILPPYLDFWSGLAPSNQKFCISSCAACMLHVSQKNAFDDEARFYCECCCLQLSGYSESSYASNSTT